MVAARERLRRAGRTAARGLTANPVSRNGLRWLRRRGALPAVVWRHLPIAGEVTVELPGRPPFRCVLPDSDSFNRQLYWAGLESAEGATVRTFFELAAEARTVVDIGANVGLYTLVACAASPTTRVIAFEPVDASRRRLIENLAANGWSDRCVVHDAAVSNAAGTASFHVPAGDFPSSASLDSGGFRGLEGAVVEVPVTTVDLAVPAGEPVDVVKIDVEGFEDRVLDGMTRVLADSQPTIVVECNPDGPAASVEERLRAAGYTAFFHLRGEGPVPIDHIVPDPDERFRNFLCRADRGP